MTRATHTRYTIRNHMEPLTDEQLVRAIQEGDVLSYEQLVTRYEHRLLAFAYRIVGSHEAAQEVVQDSLFAVYKTIDRIDTTRKFSSYVYEITKHAAISYLRKQHHTMTLDESVSIDGDEAMYENLGRNETQAEVRKAVLSLPQKYRDVLQLYYFDELSYEEIAKKLAVPINTIRTHVRRAKNELTKLLPYENT